jgi:hypothetical protein
LVEGPRAIFLQIFINRRDWTAKGVLLNLQIFAFSVRAIADIEATQQIFPR